jgi:hypothetical protein
MLRFKNGFFFASWRGTPLRFGVEIFSRKGAKEAKAQSLCYALRMVCSLHLGVVFLCVFAFVFFAPLRDTSSIIEMRHW